MGIVVLSKLHHSIIPSVFRSQRVFGCAGLFQVMFPHTNILTGGCLRASIFFFCYRQHVSITAVIETEKTIWQDLDTRKSFCGKDLLVLCFERKRTLPVDRTGTDFWFQAERSLSTPSKKSTPLKWWQLFPAVLRLTLSTLLKHFTSTSNTTNRIICCLFLLKWRLEPSHYELSPSPNDCPHAIWWEKILNNEWNAPKGLIWWL